ncbi:MAG TPA: TonB-dependent receptor plug domain-containing protein, partial [Chitinophaga sp.]
MKKHFYHMLALCCCVFLLLLGSRAFAQQQVTGRVTDHATGNGLPGVSVAVKGTTKGTATGADGSFSVSANKGQVLVFSFVGYNNQEVVIGSGPVMVSLEEKVGSLDEVVVTGYSAQRKKDLTGAVAVVNVDNLKTQPVANVNSQLQGQVSGVTVVGSGQPGQQPQVKIRGINTFGNNTPLYVVDGVPTQNIDDLNPNDIASMQVLKDASSATIYGARAANGVIIVTTRRGSAGKVRLNYDGYVGTQRPAKGNVWNLATPQ